MADTEETVNQTEVTQQGDTQVVRKSTSTASSAGTQRTIVNSIWLLLGAIEVILGLRFVFKMLGANSANSFVSSIYTFSKPFVTPFLGIFTTPTTQGNISVSVFETATIVAMLVYALIVWGIIKLVSVNRD